LLNCFLNKNHLTDILRWVTQILGRKENVAGETAEMLDGGEVHVVPPPPQQPSHPRHVHSYAHSAHVLPDQSPSRHGDDSESSSPPSTGSNTTEVPYDGPPQPKPPRSAFMCFTDAKRDSILEQYKEEIHNKADILRLVAVAWRALDGDQRAEWDETAREDKVR